MLDITDDELGEESSDAIWVGRKDQEGSTFRHFLHVAWARPTRPREKGDVSRDLMNYIPFYWPKPQIERPRIS